MSNTRKESHYFDVNKLFSTMKIDRITACQFQKQLNNFQCPFTWNSVYEISSRNVISVCEEKLTAVDDFEEFAQWTRFVLNVALCYENAKSGFLGTAFENQRECDKIILSSRSDAFMSSIEKGLQHISLANKAFLFLMQQSEEDVRRVMKTISSTDDLTHKERASILCVNAAVLMEYGLKGLKESIPLTENALKIDSECGEWHFLLGKGLSRMRRVEDSDNMDLLQREIESFENAVRISNTKFYMVLLAQSYLDAADYIYYHTGPNNLFYKLEEHASRLYREAVRDCTNNPFILGRCAHGFLKLRKPRQDITLAKELVIKGLEITTKNTFLNHTAGALFRKEGDVEKAKHYFSRAAENGSFAACIELVEIKLKDSSYDPVPDLKRYLRQFKEIPHQETLLAVLGIIHYYWYNNFKVALQYWYQIIERDIHSKKLKSFERSWLKATSQSSINEIIIKETVKLVDSEHCDKEEKKLYETVLNMYTRYYPEMTQTIVSAHSTAEGFEVVRNKKKKRNNKT